MSFARSGKKPSVLVLASTFPRWQGDSEPPFVYELCTRLAQQCDVTVLAPRSAGAATSEIWDARLHVVRYPYFFSGLERLAYQGGILAKLRSNPAYYLLVPFFLLGQLWAILRLCRRQTFDVIHAHWIFPQGFLALLAKVILRSALPVVVTSHGGDLYGLHGNVLAKIKRWVLCRADRVTVVSQAMRRDVLDITQGQVDSQVVSMGVDLQCTFTPSSAELRRPFSLLFVGRLVEKKGLPVLLRAMQVLRPEYPEIRLTVVGDGPDRMLLEQLVMQLGIDDAVEFVGRQKNEVLMHYYRTASVFVLPSIVASDGDQEGLGLVTIEAMGCGCPVIASDLPAVRDVVVNEVNGLLFDAGNPLSLVAALRVIWSDELLAASLSESGRQSVLIKYDWSRIAKCYASILAGANYKLGE